MESKEQDLQGMIDSPGFDPEVMGARFWYEAYLSQRHQLEQMQSELETLKEKLNKLGQRTSENSSQPPSQDGFKKKPKGFATKTGKKRGPKYNHAGTTRNGFEQVDHHQRVLLEKCPSCGGGVEPVKDAPVRRHEIAELERAPIQVTAYERPQYECSVCGWQGYGELPVGCREDFSYGAMLSSLVGWLGYGGHLSWSKQRYLVQTILGIPLSQGSLAKMHQWFCRSLYPSYEQWWSLVQQPGVRCVDETSYRLNGTNYWMWVATSADVCVLFLAPSRSSAQVKSLLGEDFSGILSSDCWSAYNPQAAEAKQKCLAHIERELKALEGSRLGANRLFAQKVFPIFERARQAHRAYHEGSLPLTQLQQVRIAVEAELEAAIAASPKGGWAADAQNLANRFRRYWKDWFTFLSHPQVKPDNNDAERSLRPVVIHRKVSGGTRSHWGGQLVAMMFSFLETMRLQSKNAVEELFKLLAHEGRPPPVTELDAVG